MLYQLAAAGLILPEGSRLYSPALLAGKEISLARPSPQQHAWQDLELGMFVHFAPNTWQDVESDNLSTPLAKINPTMLNTDQWAGTAIALGAKYIVFVAKHQGGFCMWQTHTTEYSIRNTPWKNGKGDVLAELAVSCKNHGLKLGVYICPRDDHFGAATGGICKTPELQALYDAMYRQQWTEVLSGYGEIVEAWFDGSTSTPVGDILKRYQPSVTVFQGPQATIRWVGNEEGFAPYPCWNGCGVEDARMGTATALNGDPDGPVWLPNEVDVSIRRPDWFWRTDNTNKILSLDQLLSIYYRSVGRGAQLLLNIPANRDGLLPDPDCKAAATFGKEIERRFGKPIASRAGRGRSINLKLDRPTRIDTVILQEDVALGERVRAYRLEGYADGTWHLLGEGSAIGHKRMQPVDPIIVSAVRLVITKSVNEPAIRTLALFHTQATPPLDWNDSSRIWAPNLVGEWKSGSFSLDLTRSIPIAGQYGLRFLPWQGSVSDFEEVVFEIGGVSNAALVKPSRSKSNEILLDITGLDKSIRVHGRVEGADAGSILLERR